MDVIVNKFNRLRLEDKYLLFIMMTDDYARCRMHKSIYKFIEHLYSFKPILNIFDSRLRSNKEFFEIFTDIKECDMDTILKYIKQSFKRQMYKDLYYIGKGLKSIEPRA